VESADKNQEAAAERGNYAIKTALPNESGTSKMIRALGDSLEEATPLFQ
jgi:hypothetical protein